MVRNIQAVCYHLISPIFQVHLHCTMLWLVVLNQCQADDVLQVGMQVCYVQLSNCQVIRVLGYCINNF